MTLSKPSRFAGLLGQRNDIPLSILISTKEKAAQLNQTMMQAGVTIHTPAGSVTGKPNLITTDPAQAPPCPTHFAVCASHIETQMNREYLIPGQLTGKDISNSGAPLVITFWISKT